MRKLTTLGLVALLLAGTTSPAGAEDDIGRKILEELRMMRKEIQALRKDLAASHKKPAVGLWSARGVPVPQLKHHGKALESYRKAMTLHPQVKKADERTIIIELRGEDGKHCRKVMKVDPKSGDGKHFLFRGPFSAPHKIQPHHGKGKDGQYFLFRSHRDGAPHKKAAPKKPAPRAKHKRDRLEQLLDELLDELERRGRGKRKHMEYF